MSDDFAQLRRWEDSGATWRIVVRTPAEVDIALLTCDAGEEVGRLRSSDPEVLEYVDLRDRREEH